MKKDLLKARCVRPDLKHLKLGQVYTVTAPTPNPNTVFPLYVTVFDESGKIIGGQLAFYADRFEYVSDNYVDLESDEAPL